VYKLFYYFPQCHHYHHHHHHNNLTAPIDYCQTKISEVSNSLDGKDDENGGLDSPRNTCLAQNQGEVVRHCACSHCGGGGVGQPCELKYDYTNSKPATAMGAGDPHHHERVVMCDLVLANAKGRHMESSQRQKRERRDRDRSLDSSRGSAQERNASGNEGRRSLFFGWRPRRGQSESDLSIDSNPSIPLPPPPPPPPSAKRRSFNHPGQQKSKSPSPYYDCDPFSCPYGPSELRCLCPPTVCCEPNSFSRVPQDKKQESCGGRSEDKKKSGSGGQLQGILRNSNSNSFHQHQQQNSQQMQEFSEMQPQEVFSDESSRVCGASCQLQQTHQKSLFGRQRHSIPSEFYDPTTIPCCQCDDIYRTLPPPVQSDPMEFMTNVRTNSSGTFDRKYNIYGESQPFGTSLPNRSCSSNQVSYEESYMDHNQLAYLDPPMYPMLNGASAATATLPLLRSSKGIL